MVPAVRDLDIYADDDFVHEITFVDAAEAALDVSDRTFTAQWRPSPGSGDTAVDFDVDDSQAADGVIVVSLTASQTRTLAPRGVWDLQTETADGLRETWLRGSVTVTPDVTR